MACDMLFLPTNHHSLQNQNFQNDKMRFAASLVLFACLVAVAMGCAHLCKDITVKNVPGCTLKGKGCKCIFHHRYQVSLSDPTTGTSGSSGWIGSETQAGEDAVYQLLSNDRGCNCKDDTIPLGNCSIKAQGCFYFQSEGNLAAHDTSLKLYAQAIYDGKASTDFLQIVNNATSKTDLETATLTILGDIIKFNPHCTPTEDFYLPLAAKRFFNVAP